MAEYQTNLQIDSERLWASIHETAKFGATPKGGVKRLTLGTEDKHVRDWFCTACRAAGCEVHIDALGSIFAVRPGRDPSKLPIGIGSHLDTQPTGGKYDGVLGTLAALEVIHTLNRLDIETEVPICLVNWTNEEGSRFAPAVMGSAAYAGLYSTQDILARQDIDGVTVGDALDAIRYRGSEPVGTLKLGAFVEVHIEQGPLLEAESKTIGVVDRGQGVIWYDGRIVGAAAHTGTTPMNHRRDALAALSELVLSVERIALEYGARAVGTIGECRIAEPSRNVIAGDVRFTMECRSAEIEVLDELDRRTRKSAADIAGRRRVEIEVEAIWRKDPTPFDPGIVDTIEAAAARLGYSRRRITSGAVHDAFNLALVMPAGMIFVPCKDGISHNELEEASQAHCTAGANVLLHTVLSLAGVVSK
jgi:N-carbamoyl-L-amino-acid hydrolase